MCLNTSSSRVCSTVFPDTEMRLITLEITRSSFLPFLKIGVMFSFFPVNRYFFWQLWLFKYDREWLSSCHQPVPSNPGRHVILSHKLEHIQPHEAVLNLLCSHSGRQFLSLDPQGYDRCGKPSWQWRLRQITHWLHQPSPCLLKLVLPSHLSEGVWHPCILLRPHISASTSCALFSLSDWPAGSCSAIPVSCLLCLIYYTGESRVRMLSKKGPEEVPVLLCSFFLGGSFPQPAIP